MGQTHLPGWQGLVLISLKEMVLSYQYKDKHLCGGLGPGLVKVRSTAEIHSFRKGTRDFLLSL